VRNEKAPDAVSLIFATPPDCLADSRLDIHIWAPQPDGGAQAVGYTLTLKRVMELAAEQEKGAQK